MLLALGLLASVALLGCLLWALGDGWYSQVRARQKLAVEVEYAGRSGQAEFLYGPWAGASAELRGHDTAVWVDPGLFAEDGPLRGFYLALMQLEDRDLETGLGVSPRGLGRALLSGGASGGSSLHDQACDAMEDGFAPNWFERRLPRLGARVLDKLDNTLCGIGLARLRSPTEVVGLYASYGYLGPGATGLDAFARVYWRYDGAGDHRLDLGHQLVLAALFNKPWTGEDARWPSIENRARHALDLLIAAGQVEPSERRRIERQIRRAKPLTRAELARRGLARRLARPPAELGYPLYRAAREAERELGRRWRTKVARLELTIDLARQRKALRASALPSSLVDQGARVTVAVVDERGAYQVLHTGAGSFDESDRIRAMRSPGSVTKLLVAAALARRYGDASAAKADPALAEVQEALRRSNASFLTLAQPLGLDPRYLSELIGCYGRPHPGAREDVIEDAATGALEASPESLLPMIQDAARGAAGALPQPHVVRAFVLRDGTRRATATGPSEARRRCAALIANDGASYSWFRIPMRGTMIAARRRVDAGKTGSVGHSADGDDSIHVDVNYWTLAIGGRATGDGFETGIVVIGADAFADRDGRSLAITGLEQASRSAAPMLARVL